MTTTVTDLKIPDLVVWCHTPDTGAPPSYYLSHELPCVTEYQEITSELYTLLKALSTPVSTQAPEFIRDYCLSRGYHP